MKIAIICLVVFALLSGICYDAQLIGLCWSFVILVGCSFCSILWIYLEQGLS